MKDHDLLHWYTKGLEGEKKGHTHVVPPEFEFVYSTGAKDAYKNRWIPDIERLRKVYELNNNSPEGRLIKILTEIHNLKLSAEIKIAEYISSEDHPLSERMIESQAILMVCNHLITFLRK
jgi:hypothetical protein